MRVKHDFFLLINVDRSSHSEILKNQKADWLKKLFKEKFYSNQERRPSRESLGLFSSPFE